MIAYRRFRNSDPPHLLGLWNACPPCPGSATSLTTDALEYFVFGQPFFDAEGLIIACDEERPVGFVHAVRGVAENPAEVADSAGAIAALIVHPDYRRRGIGRALIDHAAEFLGTSTVRLGTCENTNGMYFGLYGGSQPCGFLSGDGSLAGFMNGVGGHPVSQYRFYQKSLGGAKERVNMKVITNRRKTELKISDPVAERSWWWAARFGRLDAKEFSLVEKNTGDVLASVDVFAMDLYLTRWGCRAAGLGDVSVPDEKQRQGYALALLVTLSKYLRDQLIGVLDARCSEDDEAGIGMLEAAGFVQRDVGTIYAVETPLV